MVESGSLVDRSTVVAAAALEALGRRSNQTRAVPVAAEPLALSQARQLHTQAAVAAVPLRAQVAAGKREVATAAGVHRLPLTAQVLPQTLALVAAAVRTVQAQLRAATAALESSSFAIGGPRDGRVLLCQG